MSAAEVALVLAMSARQMDRVLQPVKRTLKTRQYGGTKPGTLLKHHIPVKTDRWDVQVPGFTEIDLVAHSGDRADGEFAYILNLTDIHTTWVESGAVLGKGQERVCTQLDALRRQLPFALAGIDSDNGSEFINAHLYRHCQTHQIQFTRGRPYKKDDNAHIEQKNWIVFLFAVERVGPTTVYSRMFAPEHGVAEDPGTGSASGPPGAYLVRYGVSGGSGATHTGEGEAAENGDAFHLPG